MIMFAQTRAAANLRARRERRGERIGGAAVNAKGGAHGKRAAARSASPWCDACTPRAVRQKWANGVEAFITRRGRPNAHNSSPLSEFAEEGAARACVSRTGPPKPESDPLWAPLRSTLPLWPVREAR